MPWHWEPTKDVISCEKLRGGANIRYIRRSPNGATRAEKLRALHSEYIGMQREPGELKHLSTRRKRKKHRFRK